MAALSSGPLKEEGHLDTLINNQPKLFAPVSMGTAAWLRLISDVVSADNKSKEDTAEQTSSESKPCLCGREHRARAASLPEAGAGGCSSEAVRPKPQQCQHRNKRGKSDQ